MKRWVLLGLVILIAVACNRKREVIYLPTIAPTFPPPPTITATLEPTLTATVTIPPTLAPTIESSPLPPTPEILENFPTATPSLAVAEVIEPPTSENVAVVGSDERLQLGVTRSGEITQPGETQRFTFLGTSLQTLSIMANLDPTAPGSLDPLVQLQAPSGDIIAEDEDMLPEVQDALIRDITLPTTGIYTVYVKSADNAGTGHYLVSLSDGFTLRDVERGAALEMTSNDKSLETYGSRDVWTLDLTAGDKIYIAAQVVDPASPFDVMVELLAPDGTSWFDNDSGGGKDAFLSEVIAPVSGTYRLHIAARNNASIGAYRLWWEHIQ
jgi:hypothetical protein